MLAQHETCPECNRRVSHCRLSPYFFACACVEPALSEIEWAGSGGNLVRGHSFLSIHYSIFLVQYSIFSVVIPSEKTCPELAVALKKPKPCLPSVALAKGGA